MKTTITIMGLCAAIALSACDSAKENAIENAYDNQADAMDNQAEIGRAHV